MSCRKRRRDMTEAERDRDWADRLSPRWWKAITALFIAAGVLYVVGAAIRIYA